MRESNLRQPETNTNRHFNITNFHPVNKKVFWPSAKKFSIVRVLSTCRRSESATGVWKQTLSRGRDNCNDKFRSKFEFDDICIIYSESHGGSHERRLLNDLMNSYQKLGRLQNINISQTRPKASPAATRTLFVDIDVSVKNLLAWWNIFNIGGIFCNLIISERPVLNESQAVTVKFGLTLQQIMDVVSIDNPNKIIIKG